MASTGVTLFARRYQSPLSPASSKAQGAPRDTISDEFFSATAPTRCHTGTPRTRTENDPGIGLEITLVHRQEGSRSELAPRDAGVIYTMAQSRGTFGTPS